MMIMMNMVNSAHSTRVMSISELSHKKERIVSKTMFEFRKYFVCKKVHAEILWLES